MRLSHSQIQLWKQCKRWWYNSYKLKLKVVQETAYMDAGNVVHKTLEAYYNDNNINLQETFDQLWNIKYKLHLSKISNRKDKYHEMVLTGINTKQTATTNELKIYFDDFLCYIDVFDSNEKVIADWKTSTRSKHNEIEYLDQLKTYCYMVYRKCGWIPDKAIVYYLKTNTTLEYIPNVTDIMFHGKQLDDINKAITEETKFPKCADNPSQCPFFCPYKNLCFATDKLEFNLITYKNNIYIEGYKSELLTLGLSKEFSFQVEGFEHIIKNKKWDGIIRLFNKGSYSLPVGFKSKLIRALTDYAKYRNKPFTYNETTKDTNKIKTIETPNELTGITLRDYQLIAAETALKNKIGLLHLSVGSGKTEIGAEIIRQAKVKTIWLTHKLELLNQTKDRLKERLGLEIGTIQGKHFNIKDITICMIQTLSKRPEIIDNFHNVGLVIVDEVHHAKSRTWINTLKKIPAPIRIGLSGSITDKPDTMMIESQLGEIIYELKSNELITQNYLAKPEIIIHKISNEMVRGSWKEVQHEFIIKNKKRNEIIAKICEDEKDKFTVIIVDRIEHGNILQLMIPNSVFINGQIDDKERVDIMYKARNGELNVLIGTVINEGIDLPKMDNIIIAKGGGVSIIPTIQAAGRVLRLNDNNKKRIYDFEDSGKYIKRHSQERIKIYKEYNEEIIFKEE